MTEDDRPSVTEHDETAALWHMMKNDPEGSRQIIREMPYEERSRFARQLRELHRMIAETSGERRVVTEEAAGGGPK